MDRAPNLEWTDSFAPYRCHAERWTLRIALRIFGAMEYPPIQWFVAARELACAFPAAS